MAGFFFLVLYCELSDHLLVVQIVDGTQGCFSFQGSTNFGEFLGLLLDFLRQRAVDL